VPTSGGGTVAMMKFTMNSLTLDGNPTLTRVTTDQPYISTNSLQVPGLLVSPG
jgi:hypothetical protein